jgi:tape measure domain-containing protein
MTTIGKVAYVATWDATNLSKGILSAQQMFREQKKITESLMSPTERYSHAVTNLENIIAKYPAVAQHKVKLEKQLERQYLIEEQALRKLSAVEKRRLNELSKSQSAVAGAVKAEKSLVSSRQLVARLAGGIAVGQTIKSSIDLAVQAEQASIQFEVLTGSVESANYALGFTKQLAAESPLSLMGVRQAAATMMQFGLSLEQTTSGLRMLSDVSGGNEERFKSLTLAYSQASAAGRLQGQDLLQMINAGFNPLTEVSKRTGESMAELRKRMEAGAISASEMQLAFVDATSAGGLFFGMTDRLGDSLGGRMAQSMSQLQEAGIELGMAIEPLLATMLDGFEQNNSLLQDGIRLIEAFADGIAFAAAVSKDLYGGLVDGQKEWTASEAVMDRIEKRDFNRQKEAAMKAKDPGNAANIPNNEKQMQEMRETAQLKLELEVGGMDASLGSANEYMKQFLTFSDALKEGFSEAFEAATEKRKEFMESGREILDQLEREQLASQGVNVELADRLGLLMALKDRGKLSESQFEAAQDMALRDNVKSGFEGAAAGSSNITANSQEAYQFLVGAQDKQFKMQQQKAAEQIALQKSTNAALEKSNQILADIAENKIGSAG